MSNQIKHRKLGTEQLAGLYYVSECMKCGWIGSSGELTEDDAQCLQPVGDDHCWGDTDEIGADRLLKLMQSGAFDKPATQLKSEPVAVLPFAEKVISKLRRFEECASDNQDVDIGRHWFDALTQLGLLNRVQRSPAYWEMTQQGEEALEATCLNTPQ